jgi:hypothetical protein
MAGLATRQRSQRWLAIRAAEQVQRWGGVLEHPEGSRLWRELGLPDPIVVDQVAWGHRARKRTWLYVVGLATDVVEAEIRTGGVPTRLVETMGALERRLTPPAFARWLVSIARRSVV